VSVEEISIGEFARQSRLTPKALRLYDELGVLVPSRVDQASGYRYYDTAQLEEARLVVMLRQLQLPLAAIKELLACDPADAATRIAEYWRGAEAAHVHVRPTRDPLGTDLHEHSISHSSTGGFTATSCCSTEDATDGSVTILAGSAQTRRSPSPGVPPVSTRRPGQTFPLHGPPVSRLRGGHGRCSFAGLRGHGAR
jgi:DNA-binding transcriptional MerR regulator